MSIKLGLAINRFDNEFKTVHEYTGPDLGEGGRTGTFAPEVLVGEHQITK